MMFSLKNDPIDATRAIAVERITRWYASRFVKQPYRIPASRPARSIQVGYRDGRIQVSADDPTHPTMQALEEFYKSADPPF